MGTVGFRKALRAARLQSEADALEKARPIESFSSEVLASYIKSKYFYRTSIVPELLALESRIEYGKLEARISEILEDMPKQIGKKRFLDLMRELEQVQARQDVLFEKMFPEL